MATSKDQTLDRSEQTTTNRSGRKGLLAGGGAIGAVLASACCILPLVLFSLGIGGAWMSNLTMLKPYQPLFIAFTLVMLGIGFYTVHRKPSNTCRADACSTDGYCGTPLAERVNKIALWSATLLIVVVLAWPYIVPLLLG